MVQPYKMKPLIEVESLYTLHYFQFAGGYVFAGEQHDFWELVYIDRGEADIGADAQTYHMTQGQAVFHQPNEFHTIYANHEAGADIFVITFASASEAMEAFIRCRRTLRPSHRKLIQRIITEGRQAFGSVMDAPYHERMILQKGASPGCDQMVLLLLTQLLIELLQGPDEATPQRLPPLTEQAEREQIVAHAIRVMRTRLDGSLRFQDICRETGVGATTLKQCFMLCIGTSVMAYYKRLRLEESKRLLRKGELNITQVADTLGYSSVQAFSRQFKRVHKVSPREYLKMVME